MRLKRTVVMILSIALSGCETKPSSEDPFWGIVEAAKARSASAYERPENLMSVLRDLSPKEILEFEKQFITVTDSAYTHELWAAAYLLNGGCSDDCFIDFRSWLISQGEKDFERVVNDPDTVGSIYSHEDGATLEEYGYAAWTVYKEKTGSELDLGNWAYPGKVEPDGEMWEEEDLPTLLPQTYKVVADQWAFPKQ